MITDTKQTEAMKAALTALKSIDEAMPFPVAKFAIRQLKEALAPALHASFLPSQLRHVEKSGAKRSTGSTADSVMSKNPV